MDYNEAIEKINEARYLATEDWCPDDWDLGWDAGMRKAVEILRELDKETSDDL